MLVGRAQLGLRAHCLQIMPLKAHVERLMHRRQSMTALPWVVASVVVVFGVVAATVFSTADIQ